MARGIIGAYPRMNLVLPLTSLSRLRRRGPHSAAMSASFSFFSKSKSAKPSGSGTTVAVRTVVKRVSTPTPAQGPDEGRLKVVAREDTPASSVSSGSKRKSEALAVPRVVKRLRASASPGVETPSRASSSVPSARSSLPPVSSSLAPSPSRSLSPLTSASDRSTPDKSLPAARQCWTEDDGHLGPGFLSCEDVVKRLMKDYVPCKCTSVGVCVILTLCMRQISRILTTLTTSPSMRTPQNTP